ncbi:MAG TPA: M23 family metallopeptidase [Pyrinomonadaceae bacterium]|nr:M23 family metallopeptidase [Pyrinomonadaceae bacterium]
MKRVNQRRVQILLGFIALVLAMVVFVARTNRLTRSGRRDVVVPTEPRQETSPQPAAVPSLPPENSPPIVLATPLPAPSTQERVPEELIIPVAGVRPDQLQDTFAQSRSEGRVHDAIDILAPKGTPVLAAADGTIVKLFHSDRGGTTIYQASVDRKFIYYYAHLDRYADGLTEGHLAKQGETIAYVGDTGNAGAGNYHLHFSIALVSDPKRYWEGTNINPYPLLKR